MTATNAPLHEPCVLIEEYDFLSSQGVSDQAIAKQLGYTDAGYMLTAVQRAKEGR